MRSTRFPFALCFLSLFALAFPLLFSQRATAQSIIQPRITQPVDETQLTVLQGNVHPLARAQFDRGAAPPDLPMNRMLLVLQRSPQQEASLRKLLDDQQDKASPNYHKWLTPEQFGQLFGPADQDIQTVTSWLQTQGFQVASISRGKTVIEFSGTAAQVQQAFHTAIHSYVVNGEQHWANSSDPSIPTALAPVVAGVLTLNNFYSKPEISRTQQVPATFSRTPTPHVTFTNPTIHALGPPDYATIYNINPAYNSGITGAGVTIGVVGRTDINLQDVADFRAAFGLPLNLPQIVDDGAEPGDLGGGEEFEAVLDATWSGVTAPGATIKLVVSASTDTTDGVVLSELYIVDNNLADVMTESFGSCEAFYTSADALGISLLAEEAAAQGITYMVSTGDSGAEGCDNPNIEQIATGPLSVNILAATPFTTAVGGTMFNEGAQSSKYWSSSSFPSGTALSYIPENVWNESCTVAQCGGENANIAAGGGGASVFFAKPSWQSGVTGIPSDGARDLPDVSLTAAFHDPYLLCFEGSCEQDLIWFISGTSASAPSFAGVMALVDQKMGGRQGHANYILYRLAAAETLSQCNGSKTSGLPASTCVFNDVTVGNNAVPGEAGYGGTNSYTSATGYDLATGLGSVNVANLINKWSSVSFNPTVTTLGLAPTTNIAHGAAVNVTASVAPSSGTGVPTGDVALQTSTGIFADGFTLAGGSIASSTNQLPGGTYTVTAHYAGDSTYAASDSAPVTVTVTPEASTTALTALTLLPGGGAGPFTTGPYGSFLYLRADVAGQSGQGIPTGGVEFLDGSAPFVSYLLSSDGEATSPNGYQTLTPGSHSISAHYLGDASFNASTSGTDNITITQASTTTALISSSTSVTSGAAVTLTATITTQSFGNAPSGTVTFFSGTTSLGSAPVSFVSQDGLSPASSITLFTSSQLPTGQDSITAQYNGDTNYTTSTSAPTTVTVQPDFAIAASAPSLTVTQGQTGSITLTITGTTGYNSTITFTPGDCAGLPSKSSCSFNPTTVPGSGSTTLSITTAAPQSAALRPRRRLEYFASLFALSGTLLAGVFLIGGPTKRRAWSSLLGMVLLAFLVTGVGCGGNTNASGGGGTVPGTPKGTYTVNVRASTASITHSASFQLTVQ